MIFFFAISTGVGWRKTLEFFPPLLSGITEFPALLLLLLLLLLLRLLLFPPPRTKSVTQSPVATWISLEKREKIWLIENS